MFSLHFYWAHFFLHFRNGFISEADFKMVIYHWVALFLSHFPYFWLVWHNSLSPWSCWVGKGWLGGLPKRFASFLLSRKECTRILLQREGVYLAASSMRCLSCFHFSTLFLKNSVILFVVSRQFLSIFFQALMESS